MTRSTVVSALSILVISISLTSIFVFSTHSEPTPATVNAPPPLLIDDDSAIPSAQIIDTEKVKQIILDRISSSDALSTIPPQRVEMLAQRAASVLVVRNQGSFDDFIALLESWGATLREPRDGPDYARLKNGWSRSPERGHAIAAYGLNETDVEFIEPTPGVAMIKNRHGVSSSGMMTDAPVNFRGNRVELLKSGADQVEVFFPVRSNAGDVRQIGMRMIWSDADGDWIPLTFIQYVEQGHAMVGSIF